MCTFVHMIESAESQYSSDVLLVAAALLDEAGFLTQVLVAVAEAETALQQEGAIGLLAMDTVLDGQPEYRRRGIDAEVERIHVGAHGAAQQASERLRVAGRIDPGEDRLERGDPLCLDGRLVQERRAEVGHLAGERARGCRGCLVEDRRNLSPRAFGDLVTNRPAVPPGWNDRRFQPGAVGIRSEERRVGKEWM